jgi:uncharacterized protein (DUF4415 family)
MRKQYDFSQAKPNPYAKALKKQVTLRLDLDTIRYFKGLAVEMGLPYQLIVNLYLRDCVQENRKPLLKWVA